MPSQARWRSWRSDASSSSRPDRASSSPAQHFVAPVEGLNRFEDRSRFVVLQVPFDDGTAGFARRDPEGLRLPDEFGKRLSGDQGAAAQLAYTEIRSPIDGVVTDRPSYPGETPPAGSPLLTVMDTSSVVARAHIPQNEAAAMKPGDSATITAPGDLQVSGKVRLVSPALDPNSTTVEVWVEAANPDGRLRPGTTVTVAIVAATFNHSVIVPTSALLKTPEGDSIVMIVSGDHARQVSVEAGVRQGDRVQITKGLSGGENVIVMGAYGLPDNTQVKIAPAQPASGNKGSN